jgi:AcrR family transcriptional regulator
MSPRSDLRERRRAEIVAAARRIVAKHGIEALTFAALEEQLEFTRGVVTYHFSNRDEIVRAVYASAIEEIDAAVRAEVLAAPTIEAQIGAVLRANVRGFIDRAEAGRVLLSFWGRIFSDAGIRRLNASLYARYRRRAARLLKGASRSIAPVDAKTMAALLVGLVIGIATQHYFDPGAIDVDEAIEEATRTVLARLARRGRGTA